MTRALDEVTGRAPSSARRGISPSWWGGHDFPQPSPQPAKHLPPRDEADACARAQEVLADEAAAEGNLNWRLPALKRFIEQHALDQRSADDVWEELDEILFVARGAGRVAANKEAIARWYEDARLPFPEPRDAEVLRNWVGRPGDPVVSDDTDTLGIRGARTPNDV